MNVPTAKAGSSEQNKTGSSEENAVSFSMPGCLELEKKLDQMKDLLDPCVMAVEMSEDFQTIVAGLMSAAYILYERSRDREIDAETVRGIAEAIRSYAGDVVRLYRRAAKEAEQEHHAA